MIDKGELIIKDTPTKLLLAILEELETVNKTLKGLIERENGLEEVAEEVKSIEIPIEKEVKPSSTVKKSSKVSVSSSKSTSKKNSVVKK